MALRDLEVLSFRHRKDCEGTQFFVNQLSILATGGKKNGGSQQKLQEKLRRMRHRFIDTYMTARTEVRSPQPKRTTECGLPQLQRPAVPRRTEGIVIETR